MYICIMIISMVACLMGLIIDSYMLLKFFLCYETFFFTMSVMMLIYSVDINVMMLVFYLLSNSSIEVMLGLSMLFLMMPWMTYTLSTILSYKWNSINPIVKSSI